MSYEYTVSIPADKRTTFRAMVKMLGGRMSRARKIEEPFHPNAETIAAMQEAESSSDLEAFDLNGFQQMVASM